MKKLLNSLFTPLMLTMILFASCQQQPQPTDEEFREELEVIKQEMQDVVKLLDDALNSDTSVVLLQRSDLALNKLESQLDHYLDQTDKAARRIDKESRNRIITIKQKIVETDFRLALLDDNDDAKRSGQLDEFYDEDTVTVRRTRPVAYRFPIIDVPDDAVLQDRVQYGEEVMEELKNDLKVLKDEVERFIQNSL